jgi:regulator of sigma E protease
VAIIFLIIGIVLFIGLVVVHELGHFIVARRNGVDVEEFGIGFPPRAWSRKTKDGYIFSLNWLPLGGFVRLKGEHDSDTQKGSYGASKLQVKLKILLAGVTMNFLAAVAILTLLAIFAMPKTDLARLPFYDKPQFSVPSDTKILSNKVLIAVVPDSPAAKSGLQSGDQLLRVAGTEIQESESLPALTEKLKGQTVAIEYVRDSEQVQRTDVTLLNDRNSGVGYLGVAPITSQTFRATWSAPLVGFMTAVQYTDVSFRGLGFIFQSLFAGQTEVAGSVVGGPVATFKILSDTSSVGIGQLLFVVAIISISLAVMNILPIPALDGGRAFVTLLFKLMKKPLKGNVEDLIHGTGFALLMLLIVFITVLDVRRFF